MSRRTYRDEFRPIIARVIEEHGTGDRQQLRRELRAAAPWFPSSWARKVWNDEIRVQLGIKRKRPTAYGRGQRCLPTFDE